uniref:Uncharacterized protein n=1 Tax=Tanacetum cinerariifolium TaxID=118510 RepID=A0A699I1U6_TANCI|nr:hypothetical protein [Tanacetum cinerariifolium]
MVQWKLFLKEAVMTHGVKSGFFFIVKLKVLSPPKFCTTSRKGYCFPEYAGLDDVVGDNRQEDVDLFLPTAACVYI